MDREAKEYEDLVIFPHRPDGVLDIKKKNNKMYDKIFIESQGIINQAWKDKIERNYQNSVVVIIDNKQVAKAIVEKRGLKVLEVIDDYITSQMEIESYKPPEIKDRIPKTKRERKDTKRECQYCGQVRSLHSIYPHEYGCDLNPKNRKENE